MKPPKELQWLRVEELADKLAKLSHEQVVVRIAELADAGESPTVLTLLGTWLELSPPIEGLKAGTVLGERYQLLEKVGEGGMGSVWRAEQQLISRDVALKVIHPALATPALTSRFVGEMKVLGQLDHMGIVKIFDAGLHREPGGGSIPFFAMELVEGQLLDDWAAGHRSDPAALLRVATAICGALGSAHERLIVHRDLKPSNIIVRKNGQPVVLDFGIARLRGLVFGDDEGVFSGTPQYAAPEQHLGRDHDFRSGESVDVYAAGAVIFEMFAGRRLFDFAHGTPITEMRHAVLTQRPLRLAEVLPGCSTLLDEVLGCAVRRKPSDRFYSISAFGRALEKCLKELSPAQKTQRRWSATVDSIVPGTRWKLEKKIGEGGAGEVWIGRHDQLNVRRVFKFCDTEEKARTLKRELTLFRLLKERVGRNPHFVQLHDVSLDEPPWYLMMEFVEARDLGSWCKALAGGIDSLAENLRLEIIIQSAEALQAAHEAGILHRDVKPGNLLVLDAPNGQVHVLVADFGIGQLATEELLHGETRLGFTRTVSDLRGGPLSGTMLYLAPELLAGHPATARSDIYSLGVVLWQLLISNLHVALDPADWGARISDPLLREDLNRCLAGSPEKRWASAGELATSLRSLPERRATQQHRLEDLAARERAAYRRGLARATTIAAAVLALIGALAWHSINQSKIARRAQFNAQLGEVAASRSSQEAGKRAKAWSIIQANAARAPAELKVQLRNEAIAILALPNFSMIPAEIPGSQDRAVVSKDLTAFASISKSGQIAIYRREGSEKWAPAVTNPPTLADCTFLGLSTIGAAVCALLQNGEARVWNGGSVWQRIEGPFAPAGIVISPGGLAAGARPDGSIDLWRVRRDSVESAGSLGKNRARPIIAGPPSTSSRPFPPARSAVTMAISRDGDFLASGSGHSLFTLIWSAETNALVAAGAHKHAVTSVAWNPEAAAELASGAEDGVAILWNLDHREDSAGSEKNLFLRPVHEFVPPSTKKFVVRDVAFGCSGRALFVLYDDGTLGAFDTASGRFLESIDNGTWARTSLGVGRNQIAFVDKAFRLDLLNLVPQPVFQETKAFRGAITAVDADDAGALFLARGHEGCVVFEPLSLRFLGRLTQAFGTAARFNPGTGALVLIGGGQMNYFERLVDPSGSRSLIFRREKRVSPGDFTDLDMVALGQHRVGSVSNGQALRIRSTGQAVPAPVRLFDTATIRKQRLHPSGKWVAAIANEEVQPVSLEATSKSPKAVNVPAKHYLDLAFSPDGLYLALRNADEVRIVMAETREEATTFPCKARIQTDAALCFSSDSRFLLVTGFDANPTLFHVPSRTSEQRWEPFAKLTAPVSRDVTFAHFGGPGRCFLILGTADGYFQAWNFAMLRRNLRQVGLDWEAPPFHMPDDRIAVEKVRFD